MAFFATGTPDNYTIGGLQFLFWELASGVATTAPITSVDIITKTFTLTGDLTTELVAGVKFRVSGSTGNDGLYTVVSSTLVVTDTEVVVEETIADATGDGTVNVEYGGYQQFGNIVTGSFTSDVTFLDHFSAKTGTRLKDRTVAQEITVTVSLTVDEPTPELLNLFVLGGDITDNITDKTFNPYTTLERSGAGRLYGVSDTGNEFQWDFSSCTVKPDGEFSYNDQDWSQFSFEIEVLADSRFAALPYGTITHYGTDTDLTPPFT